MVKKDLTFENNLIKIGENANDNDKIISEANQNDIWFHLDKFPSCHVILSCSKKYPPNEKMLYYCAKICKENTKFRNLPNIKIKYTKIKNIQMLTKWHHDN